MRNAPVSEKAPVGVFVGLATLDVIHRIARAPAANEKITSTAQFVAAGGPAPNAAVTFAGLGGDAILVTALGDDSVAELIRADLAEYGVSVVDAEAGTTRSLVSLDAVNSDVPPSRIDRSTHVAALRCSVVGPWAWLSELRIEQTRKRER
jgi:hypothetical protein